MYRTVVTLATLLLAALNAFPQAHAGLGSYPMKVWFNGGPGVVQTQIVHLVNTAPDTLDIGVFLKDWQYDSLGNTLIYPSASTGISCTDWIKFSSETKLRLSPGEDRSIAVTMEEPPRAKDHLPVHTAMLIFEQLNPIQTKDARGVSIKVALQIGVKLYHTSPDSVAASVEIKSFKKVDTTAQLTLINNGKGLVDGSLKCTLTNKENGKTVELPKVVFYTLPGDTRILSVPLPHDLAVGDYLITGLVDSEALDEVQAAQLDMTWGNTKASY